MPTVRDILAVKGTQVHTVSRQTSVLDAAKHMNNNKVGCLVVMDGDRVAGMFSERDILQRVVATHRDSATTRVEEVMTTEIVVCRPHTKLLEARGTIKTRRIRHLPVLDDDEHLVGLISIGDLNAHDMHEHESTIYIMEQYIHGRT